MTPARPAAEAFGSRPFRLVTGPPLGDPGFPSLAVAHALLPRAGSDGSGYVLVHRPLPAVAFGRLDALRPGFAGSAAAARARGFDSIIREAGGRAAAFHRGSLVVDVVAGDAAPRERVFERFAAVSGVVVEALERLGVPARIEELPGEYCPGRYSVAAGGLKLGGAAQRIVRSAWHVAVSVVAEDSASLRDVLREVYGCLDYPLDLSTVGAAADVAPAVTVANLEREIVDAWGRRLELIPGAIDPEVLAHAREIEAAGRPLPD
jgi:octanoyl-[GcvH]:protein N-octanoyltransferase